MTEINELLIYSKLYPIITETNLTMIPMMSNQSIYFILRYIISHSVSKVTNLKLKTISVMISDISNYGETITLLDVGNNNLQYSIPKTNLNILIIRSNKASKLISIAENKSSISIFEVLNCDYSECIDLGIIVYIARINIEIHYEKYKHIATKIGYSTWIM